MELMSITLHSDKGSIHCQQRSTKQQQIIKYPMISFPRCTLLLVIFFIA